MTAELFADTIRGGMGRFGDGDSATPFRRPPIRRKDDSATGPFGDGTFRRQKKERFGDMEIFILLGRFGDMTFLRE